LPKILLTDISLRALKVPPSGQITYLDKTLSGFGVRVSQGGTKTFVLVHGPTRQRTTIGRFPIISLSDARTRAKQLLAERTLGKTAPARVSFDEAKTRFLETREQKNRPRTVADYKRLLSRHFNFGRTQLSEITTSEIERRVRKLAHAPAEATHALVAAKTFFRWCVKRRYLQTSPCDGLDAPKTPEGRERVLTDEELRKVLSMATSEPFPFGPIVTLLILTGQRRGEIGALKWNYIDLQERVITLPASLTKNRRQHTFPYGKTIADLLAAAPKQGDYLFPAARSHVRDKPTTVFNGWPKAKAALDAKLDGVAPWTLHDLRRTFSSNLAAIGVAPHVTERLLNHISGKISGVAAIYNRHSYMDEMRAAVTAWETRLADMLR
jgi:integrase